jgi:RHS repeat-associated protein
MLGLRAVDLVAEYTGHPYDAVLGMYFAEARMYDAADRRFVAVDPVKGSVANSATLAQYTYVLDNPLRWVDPLGLEKIVISGNHAYIIPIIKDYAVRNFIEPGIKTLKEWFQQGGLDESITWIVADYGYNDSNKMGIFTAINEIKLLYGDQFDEKEKIRTPNLSGNIGGSLPDQLSYRLKDGEHYLNIIFVSTENELFDYISDGKTLVNNKGKAYSSRSTDLISEMVVYSHGVKGELSLSYNSIGGLLNITSADLKKRGNLSSAFSKDYFCVLYACNTGTVKDGTSFAQEWADATGGQVIGLASGKTDYEYINSGRDAQWYKDDRVRRYLGYGFDTSGSLNYPVMSKKNSGTWYIYTPDQSPINADELMKSNERKDTLPTLQSIVSIIPMPRAVGGGGRP